MTFVYWILVPLAIFWAGFFASYGLTRLVTYLDGHDVDDTEALIVLALCAIWPFWFPVTVIGLCTSIGRKIKAKKTPKAE
jgi:hypothetical protein